MLGTCGRLWYNEHSEVVEPSSLHGQLEPGGLVEVSGLFSYLWLLVLEGDTTGLLRGNSGNTMNRASGNRMVTKNGKRPSKCPVQNALNV